jgi:hypothetical protein
VRQSAAQLRSAGAATVSAIVRCFGLFADVLVQIWSEIDTIPGPRDGHHKPAGLTQLRQSTAGGRSRDAE